MSSASITHISQTQRKEFLPSNSRGGDDVSWKPFLEEFLSKEKYPELYEKSLAIDGRQSLPIFCIETQCDLFKEKRHMNTALMKRVENHTQFVVEKNDAAIKETRTCFKGQLKYAMHNNGDHGDNSKRKQVCLATILNLFHYCRDFLLKLFLDTAKANGWEIDDLTDALSLALLAAIMYLANEINRIFNVSRTLDNGSTHLDLGARSIRAFATDPGTRNFACCLLEVTNLDPAKLEYFVTSDGETKSHDVPRPHFRILRWDLIDLVKGTVKASYKGPSPLYRRLDENGNVTAPAVVGRVPVITDGAEKAKKKKPKKARRKSTKTVLDLTEEW